MCGPLERAVRLQLALILGAVWLLGRTVPDTLPSARFAWAAPALENPVTVELGDGYTYTRLLKNHDYIIQLPQNSVKNGATFIEGGRNLIIQGGHIRVPAGGESDTQRRALYIKNASGIVHIEGILIDGADRDGFDGIAISAPQAIVQIVNVRIMHVTGRFDGFHGDVIQPFGGVRELRVDHLTASSSYQGLYLPETQGAIGSVILRNINLSYDFNIYDETTYLLWLPVDRETCHLSYPVTIDHVYIDPRPEQDVAGSAVWPNSLVPPGCPATQGPDGVHWPALTDVTGSVLPGAPPAGDFVPESSFGFEGR